MGWVPMNPEPPVTRTTLTFSSHFFSSRHLCANPRGRCNRQPPASVTGSRPLARPVPPQRADRTPSSARLFRVGNRGTLGETGGPMGEQTALKAPGKSLLAPLKRPAVHLPDLQRGFVWPPSGRALQLRVSLLPCVRSSLAPAGRARLPSRRVLGSVSAGRHHPFGKSERRSWCSQLPLRAGWPATPDLDLRVIFKASATIPAPTPTCGGAVNGRLVDRSPFHCAQSLNTVRDRAGARRVL